MPELKCKVALSVVPPINTWKPETEACITELGFLSRLEKFIKENGKTLVRTVYKHDGFLYREDRINDKIRVSAKKHLFINEIESLWKTKLSIESAFVDYEEPQLSSLGEKKKGWFKHTSFIRYVYMEANGHLFRFSIIQRNREGQVIINEDNLSDGYEHLKETHSIEYEYKSDYDIVENIKDIDNSLQILLNAENFIDYLRPEIDY